MKEEEEEEEMPLTARLSGAFEGMAKRLSEAAIGLIGGGKDVMDEEDKVRGGTNLHANSFLNLKRLGEWVIKN